MTTGFIDWTEKAVHLYIFEKRNGHCTMTDSLSLPLSNGLEEDILKSFSAHEYEDVYLSLPLSMLTMRQQELPFSDRDKIRDTIPYELEGILLGNVNDYMIDHMVIESSQIKSSVLAVCIEKSELRRVIDMFSSAGIEPKMVTSLDIMLAGGNSNELVVETVSDTETRARAAEEEIFHPTINLRQKELAYMGDVEKFIKKLRLTTVLLLVLLIVFAANAALRYGTLKNEHTHLTNEINNIYRSVFPEDKKIIDAERQFKGNMNTLLKKKEALRGIPVLDILLNIANHSRSMIKLHEFSADSKNIVLKGTAASFEEVESLKNDFASVFSDVKVTDSGARADKKIGFTIVMREERAW